MKPLLSPEILREMLTEHGIPKEGVDFIVSEFDYTEFEISVRPDGIDLDDEKLSIESQPGYYCIELKDCFTGSAIVGYSNLQGAAQYEDIKSKDLSRVMRFMAAFGITEF